ncbi:MAG: methionine synthase [Rikenellaceae bacterium]|jgi:5-methyltetrahydrofolate--homocysteine methyltransferase|nr:methionine synthase [Rikenellaceae bacterium]
MIYDELDDRILILDGGLGTMVQRSGPTERDFRGELFADHPIPLRGCNDILVLTSPQIISNIHEAYLAAGADIISTDTFNANAVSLADYGLENYARRINFAATKLARTAADSFSTKEKPRFVAGSLGPTSRTASMSADVDNPAAREVTFDELVAAYTPQIEGMVEGGADLFIVETVFDTLNAKAALLAIGRSGCGLPVIVSGTLSDSSGRTLSGQTVEAFYYSVAHANLLAVGLNCGFGARQLYPYLSRLADVARCRVSCHPNAGLPNISGEYDESPAMMAADVENYLRDGLVNIIGGCCGTTPEHIAAVAAISCRYKPRKRPTEDHITTLCGLEPLRIAPESNFVNVGERSNVAGSARFAKMIREGRYEEAVAVAREQVEAGAQIVDVCMDDGLIDGAQAMSRFLNLAMAEPEVARAPMMIDSSKWEVIEAGLKCVQGKSIVNSISLKEGEEEFLRRARLLRDYGAAAVVMLFDERGQADAYDRKIEVASRAYGLLTNAGFPPEDIIFDPNVLAIATGIAEHDRYAVNFIEAIRYIKKNLPHAKVSGGVSNLSFAFRGNNAVREAMHSAFLYHAIAAGMDMGIVNPALLQVYTDVEPQLLALAEDAVLARREDAAERLSAFAASVQNTQAAPTTEEARRGTLPERIDHAMLRGVADHIGEDALEAYNVLGSAIKVIDTLLMPAMTRVGELFGEGKMFLPQVVKSARVMRRAVDALTPYMGASENASDGAPQVLMATVKGDVHDIGKNIVSVVMACNGYRVVDLGVMTPSEKIVERAAQGDIFAVGLSGLITPSLEEMIRTVRELERAGLDVPVIIGGATTSRIHTAVKIAPHYRGVVVHSRDASENVAILASLASPGRESYIKKVRREQQEVRKAWEQRDGQRRLLTLTEARANGYRKQPSEVVRPLRQGLFFFHDYPVEVAAGFIDWNFFFPAWEMKGRYLDVLQNDEARKLFDDAQALLQRIADEKLLTLKGVVGIYPARRDGDAIILDNWTREFRLAQLRDQAPGRATNLSLADFVCDEGDYVGAFMLTAGVGLRQLVERFNAAGDSYNAIMGKLLADRLTEAFAEAVHSRVRTTLWGYESKPLDPVNDMERLLAGKYQGVRMAFGYPACPDHSLKREVFELLEATGATSATLGENFMIDPAESLCGLMFAGAESRYFSVGHIDDEQLEWYAGERGMDVSAIKKLTGQ